jgi:hypothetical protein
MTYSRQNPSPRYQALLAMYRDMHLHGDRIRGHAAARTFDGRSLVPQAQKIRRLIQESGARRILDYGSGKGTQYDIVGFAVPGEGEWDSVLDYWEVDEVVCFDPAYTPYSRVPEGKFDGVIATDVLEHCPEEDVPWILDELFAYSRNFVYANVACFPARKRLPSGGNAHCTIKPVKWWEEQFSRAVRAHPGVRFEVRLAYIKGGQVKLKIFPA